MLRILAVIALMLMPSISMAQGYPDVDCTLNEDKSDLVVTALNTDGNNYRCKAFCRFKATGQRPIQYFDCQFNLGKNAAKKTVCTREGGASDFYSEIMPTAATCVPR